MARVLWQRWSDVDEDAREPDGPVGFLKVTTSHISKQDSDTDNKANDWEATMLGRGIEDGLRHAVLGLDFLDLRRAASACNFSIWFYVPILPLSFSNL